jgi:hypothetical protein
MNFYQVGKLWLTFFLTNIIPFTAIPRGHRGKTTVTVIQKLFFFLLLLFG